MPFAFVHLLSLDSSVEQVKKEGEAGMGGEGAVSRGSGRVNAGEAAALLGGARRQRGQPFGQVWGARVTGSWQPCAWKTTRGWVRG